MVTAKEFRTWQASVEIEGRPIRGVEIARRLGRSPETIAVYRNDGINDQAEMVMRLAMAAISEGVKPWGFA